MFNRREALKSMSLGSGALLLGPIWNQLMAQAEGAGDKIPQRFVFVERSNGLRPWGIAPKGLEEFGDQNHQQKKYFEAELNDRDLNETMKSLVPIKKYVTIINDLSGRAAAVSDPHGSNFGLLGVYRSDQHAPPAAETIDGALAKAMPSIFPHIGFKMGAANDFISHPALSALDKGKPLPFYCSPTLAYKELFGAFAKGDDLKAADQLDKHLLDFMVDDVKRMKAKLAGPEKEKLDHYLEGFESLRDRKIKLATIDDSIRVHIPSVTDKYTSPIETHRLEAHFDLAAAAMIAGLTNVITIDADDLDVHYSGLGLGEKSVHGIGHLADDYKQGRDTNFADGTDGAGARNIIRKYQIDLIAGLAKKLEAIPEGAGTMLDNTLIVFVSDAGHQHHANYQNFPMVLVGNVRGKLNTGRYINYPAYGNNGNRTIGSFYTSLLHAAGHPRDGFGQLDLNLPIDDQKTPLGELFV